MSKYILTILLALIPFYSKAETLNLLCTGDGDSTHGQIDEDYPIGDPLRFIELSDKNTVRFILTVNTQNGDFFTKRLGGVESGRDNVISHPYEKNKRFKISEEEFSNVGEYTGYVGNEWYKHKHKNSLNRLTGVLVNHYSKTESTSNKIHFSHKSYICVKATPKF